MHLNEANLTDKGCPGICVQEKPANCPQKFEGDIPKDAMMIILCSPTAKPLLFNTKFVSSSDTCACTILIARPVCLVYLDMFKHT